PERSRSSGEGRPAWLPPLAGGISGGCDIRSTQNDERAARLGEALGCRGVPDFSTPRRGAVTLVWVLSRRLTTETRWRRLAQHEPDAQARDYRHPTRPSPSLARRAGV